MKKKNSDEIDLIDIFIVIKQNFIKVLLITIVFICLMFIYLISQKSEQISYTAKTKILPISTFDVSDYSAFNSYLKEYSLKKQYKLFKKDEGDSNIAFNIETPNLIDNFNLINKRILLDLFIDKLKEREIFIEAIKKFDLVNEENFQFQSEYENKVREIANRINIINYTNKPSLTPDWNLVFQVTNKDKWDSFLYYVEDKTNEEVRKYLIENFNRLVSHENNLKNYKIEDLDVLIQNNQGDSKLQEKFLKDKKMMITDQSMKRLQNLFITTPLLDKEKFYASKLIVHSTEYNIKTQQTSKKVSLISIAVIGFIFGIIYVIIFNSVKNRAKKSNL